MSGRENLESPSYGGENLWECSGYLAILNLGEN
jgi:hypothetical protein